MNKASFLLSARDASSGLETPTRCPPPAADDVRLDDDTVRLRDD